MSNDFTTEDTTTDAGSGGTEILVGDTDLSQEVLDLLETSFDDPEAAKEIVRTTETARAVIDGLLSNVDPEDLRQRVGLKLDLLDNTGSMTRLIGLLAGAHDKALDMVSYYTAEEPVDVLVAALWLNRLPGNETGVAYPFTPLAQAPRLAGTNIRLTGLTPWFDRYAELLAAFTTQVTKLEDHNKTVYGMMGLYTDGFDNNSKLHTPATLAKMVRSYRRGKTHLPYAVYMGHIAKPGDSDYDRQVTGIIRDLEDMNIEPDQELVDSRDLKGLIKQIFTACGFDRNMVFLPGDDIKEIVSMFVQLSKLMASVSKGQLPEGLENI